MKKLVILIFLSLKILPIIIYPFEPTLADKWIEDQLNMQFSETIEAFTYKGADFSFCKTELIDFIQHKKPLFDIYLKDRDAHDIQELYKTGIYKGIIIWQSPLYFFSESFQFPEHKKVRVRDIVLYYLAKMYKSQEDEMNIILTINSNVLKEAEYWDLKHSEMDDYPLFGIPIGIKANIGTADGQPTSAGAKALKNSHCIKDAFIIEKIREAGGIIIAKTNLSEWAYYMSDISPCGFSTIGGQTRNPHGRFEVGGSSSGSAAAIAMGLVPMAIGTETSGSIIYPASQNGITGLKPSLGLVSRDCIIPIAEAQDTAGPMTSSARDAALLLSVISAYDKTDPATDICNNISTWFLPLGKDGYTLEGLKLGLVSSPVMRQYYRTGEGIDLLRIAGELSEAGAKIILLEMNDDIFYKLDINSVFEYQFREGLNHYLQNFTSQNYPANLFDIIEYNKENPEKRMPFGQELLEASQESSHSKEFIHDLVLSNRNQAGKVINQQLEENELDLLITLSNHMSYIYSAAGYPAICVPAGKKTTGEPIGITFIGSFGDDKLLLETAYAYERIN